MRIGIEATSLVLDRRGIGRYVREVLRAMARLDLSLEFIFYVQPKMVTSTHADVVALELGAGMGRIALVEDIPAADYDLFWCPWTYTRHWPARGPVVVTLHDVTPLCFPDQLPLALIPRLKRRYRIRRSGRLADLILTDSEFSRDEIVRVLAAAPQRITVAPLGVGGFSPGDRAVAAERLVPFGVTRPFVLYVGGHEERKNLARLIEGFGRFRASPWCSACDLVLAGPTAELPEAVARQIAASAEPEAVHYLAGVDDETLQSLYRAAEALVYPSLYEGFGLPVLEAMASGTPVVISSARPMPEVAGGAARYFDPLDVGDMARQIARAVNDREQSALLAERGIERAAQFTWDRTGRTTLAAFRELVQERAAGTAKWTMQAKRASAAAISRKA